MKYIKRFFVYLILISQIFTQNLYGEDNNVPEPYNSEEFPQALKDLRRFEIITLGSMPFVMLDTNIVYSFIRYYNHDKDPAFKPNPFGAKNYEQSEQIGLIVTSISISAGIGLTDFIVQKVKQSKAKKSIKRNNDQIVITPVSEDPEAVRIKPKNRAEDDSDDEVEVLD